MKKTIFITTLGCKVNQYDSGALLDSFMKNGFTPFDGSNACEPDESPGIISDGSGPDVVVVNTCIVTAESERKSRQAIRRMRARFPNAALVVAGCYPSKFPEKAAEIEGVDFIAGVTEYEGLADKLAWVCEQKRNASAGRSRRETESNGIPCDSGADSLNYDNGAARDRYSLNSARTRAYIKIQDGCDNYCSYCIVPYARGGARSRNWQDILNETGAAAAARAPEIVLTGTHISSYSHITPKGNESLGELIKTVAGFLGRRENPVRLRLSSIEPTIVTPAFVELLSESRGALCPHFHLSLQSGCENTLRRMNRRYAPADYRRAVELLRGAFPEAGFTTDVIVGFPGESEADFIESYGFCREIAFSKIHVFPYSIRPGTRAAQLDSQVDARSKRDRAKRLIALSDELSFKFHAGYVGKIVRILIENQYSEIVEGLTGNYIRVRARYGATRFDENMNSVKGLFADVRVTEVAPHYAFGAII